MLKHLLTQNCPSCQENNSTVETKLDEIAQFSDEIFNWDEFGQSLDQRFS